MHDLGRFGGAGIMSAEMIVGLEKYLVRLLIACVGASGLRGRPSRQQSRGDAVMLRRVMKVHHVRRVVADADQHDLCPFGFAEIRGFHMDRA